MTQIDQPILITAAGVADASGLSASPGCVLIEPGKRNRTLRVLASGSPAQVEAHPGAASARRVSRAHAVLIPALVNAHAHLDLTTVGPRPYDDRAGFAAWLDMVRRSRATDPRDIHSATAKGIALSLRGGVIAVGDIAGGRGGDGRLEAARVLVESPMLGVSFVELFGSVGLPEGLVGLATPRVRVGVQPHAPYSASPDLYTRAMASGLPVATHLGESLAERELLTRGTGPIRSFLESLGVWTPEVAARYGGTGGARSSVDYLRRLIELGPPILLAHVNDADDDDLELLSRSNCSVAYCPRAHAYFGHDRDIGGHRYRDMTRMGINVALGTDSIINLPAHQADRISTLDEMRLLWRRDRTDTGTLLRMATTNGARALGLAESLFTFSPGATAGVAAVDVRGTDASHSPLERVMEANGDIELLTLGEAES